MIMYYVIDKGLCLAEPGCIWRRPEGRSTPLPGDTLEPVTWLWGEDRMPVSGLPGVLSTCRTIGEVWDRLASCPTLSLPSLLGARQCAKDIYYGGRSPAIDWLFNPTAIQLDGDMPAGEDGLVVRESLGYTVAWALLSHGEVIDYWVSNDPCVAPCASEIATLFGAPASRRRWYRRLTKDEVTDRLAAVGPLNAPLLGTRA